MTAPHRETVTPFWRPDRLADRRPYLVARGRIAAGLRAWFAEAGFTEVETAVAQASPGNEVHLHAFATTRIDPAGGQEALYLRTSPEFALKKLLAAGESRVFEFARCFRNREAGPLHHPEFTMLEWYRAGEPYETVIADAAALVQRAAAVTGARQAAWRGRTCDLAAAPERLSVQEAFLRHAGIDLLATLDDRDALAAAAARAGTRVAPDDTWSDLFSKLLVEHVEGRLGLERMTVLDEYPACEAALARLSPRDERVAERFELYACGVELANGYGELTDAAEQRRRFTQAMAEKERRYGEAYPVDEDFLAALATMPPASGVALGFDRLVMLAAGAPHIEQVLWAPMVQTR